MSFEYDNPFLSIDNQFPNYCETNAGYTQTELVDKFNAAFLDAQQSTTNPYNSPDAQSCDQSPDGFYNGVGPFGTSVFYVTPPLEQFRTGTASSPLELENEDFDLSDIELYDSLSTSSFDLETIASEWCDAADFWDGDQLCNKSYVDLNNFIRNSPADAINLFAPNNEQKHPYGHLLGNEHQTNLSIGTDRADNESQQTSNQMVVTQIEAILHDDPLLSSTSVIFPNVQQLDELESELKGNSDTEFDDFLPVSFQCKWEQCYEIYQDQKSLVKHIEKSHVEMKKGDEFACFWLNCMRKSKPFNARYKLLIHMRVHSGEKPNRCPFNGCNKAFSRLENLKIHQRSHTGERPYQCQFSQCTKSFSNSSDRAKHQRTHYDTKPYACQIVGCPKRYTDPSSLRKHVKNHSTLEQEQLKKQRETLKDDCDLSATNDQKQKTSPRKFDNNNRRRNDMESFQKIHFQYEDNCNEHSYSNSLKQCDTKENTLLKNVKIDLKNKIAEKNKQKELNRLYNIEYF